jgi:hypothetical protein
MSPFVKVALISGSLFMLVFGSLVMQAQRQANTETQVLILARSDKELDNKYPLNPNPEKIARIDLTDLLEGGPPKDGIPSIDQPRFDTAKTTPFQANEWVIGVVVNGEAKAYPFGILNWHEIVNDQVGGVNVAITYCPLCDTGIVVERGNTTYGVSGKLYQSCLVMYDRADETLYAQPWTLGIAGTQVNRSLKRVPAVKTTLKNWLEQHPNSQVLSTQTGHRRDYLRYPYDDYYTSDRIIFPVRNQNRRNLPPKETVSYVWEANRNTPKNRFSGASHQFIHSNLKRVGTQVVDFNGRQIRARWDARMETVVVEELDGTSIPSTTSFAFVYPAFFE